MDNYFLRLMKAASSNVYIDAGEAWKTMDVCKMKLYPSNKGVNAT